MDYQKFQTLLLTFYPLLIIIFLYIFHYISLQFIISSYLIFCLFKYFYQKCELSFIPTNFNKKLINSCPNLKYANFKQYFPLPFVLIQFIGTKLSKFQSQKKIILTEEKINEFGSTLIWVNYEGRKNPHNKPILFIMPGITGKFSDAYVFNLSYQGLENDYDVVIYQMRTLSYEFKFNGNKFDFLDDIEESLKYIKSKNKNKIFAVGGSYGANLLVNYLGTKNLKEKLIEYAISISNPFDFFLCNRIGEESKNIYEILVLKFYKRNYLPGIYHCNKYKKCSFFDEKKLQNAQKIIDFDKEFFTKFLGYKNTDEYYRKISCFENVKNINIPTLFIQAKDDPITFYYALPFDDIKNNENIILLSTDCGGHLCFLEANAQFGFQQWIYKPVFDFFNYLRYVQK